MIVNVILGIVFLFGNIGFKTLGLLFLIAPYIANNLSKEIKNNFEISAESKKDLKEIAYKTWKFFEDNLNEENHYLVCDNYQEDRKPKTVKRTSSTNIGLEMLSIMSAYDLGFIDFEKAKDYIKKVINSIKIMPKWNGHLYNWYETDTLEPLKPRYVSTVDSGNLVGYLYVIKEFLKGYIEEEGASFLYEDIDKIISLKPKIKIHYIEKSLILSSSNTPDDKQKAEKILMDIPLDQLSDSELNCIGLCYIRLKDIEKAEKIYTETNLYKRYPVAKLNLCKIYIIKNRYKEAALLLTKYIADCKKPIIYDDDYNYWYDKITTSEQTEYTTVLLNSMKKLIVKKRKGDDFEG